MRPARKIAWAAAAEADLDAIASWTAEKFGAAQAEFYIDCLLDTVAELAALETHARSRAREDIAPGVRTLHMRTRDRRGQHFILYREIGDAIAILRILHDGMEMSRHLPEEECKSAAA